jgi:hypothetical protein
MYPSRPISLRDLWRSSRSARVGIILFAACVANMFACGLIAGALGGDGLAGMVEANRYYLGDHGRYTEVSRTVYTYSRIHMLSFIASAPIGIIGWTMCFAAQNRLFLRLKSDLIA